MIATLPHPTKLGAEALYVLEDNPKIPQAWFDQHATAGMALRPHALEPRTELEQILWRLMHRAHTASVDHIRAELERALPLVEAIADADYDAHKAVADILWERTREMYEAAA